MLGQTRSLHALIRSARCAQETGVGPERESHLPNVTQPRFGPGLFYQLCQPASAARAWGFSMCGVQSLKESH